MNNTNVNRMVYPDNVSLRRRMASVLAWFAAVSLQFCAAHGMALVTFQACGGVVEGKSSTTRIYNNVGTPYGTLPTATRTGFTFDGWWTTTPDKIYGRRITENSLVDQSIYTLYARWTNNSSVTSQTVYFYGNGGNSPVSQKTYSIDGTYGWMPRPARAGYSFSGWWTSSSGGTEVTELSYVTTTASRSLYAHWTSGGTSYIWVSFDVNGGVMVDDGTVFHVGNNDGLPNLQFRVGYTYGNLPTATRSGYKFMGWSTAWDGGSSITELTTVSDSVFKVYALWLADSPTTYTITYNPGANGSGSQQTATKTKDVALTLKGAIFTRTGYTQTGWSTSDGGAKAYNLSSSYTANADATLYPYWTEIAVPADLAFVKPDEWGAAALVSSVQGSRIPQNSFTVGDKLYLSFCYGNLGDVDAGAHKVLVELISVGTVLDSGEMPVASCMALESLTLEDFLLGTFDDAGSYKVRITLDSGNDVSEGDETNNVCEVEFEVAAAAVPITLAEALDNEALVFTTGGSSAWSAQTVSSHDGVDAAASGEIGKNGSVWLQTTVSGPGTVSFWTRVSCGYCSDFLHFYVDGTDAIWFSGIDDESTCMYTDYPTRRDGKWVKATIPVSGTGTHILRWTYTRSEWNPSGEDRCWLDQVVWSHTPPPAPTSVSATDGTSDANVAVSWTDVDEATSYAVYRSKSGNATDAVRIGHGIAGTAFADYEAEPGITCRYWVKSENGAGESAFGASDTGWRAIPLPLGPALDNEDLTFTTGGDASWFPQSVISHDDTDAIQSGPIGSGETSWFSTTVSGTGTLSFWWKTTGALDLYVDGAWHSWIFRTSTDWERKVVEMLEDGDHFVKWRFMTTAGSGAGWVDHLSWEDGSVQTVSFDTRGGTCETTSGRFISGNTYSHLPAPVRSGFGFAGWWTLVDGGTQITTNTIVSADESRTFYARWFEAIPLSPVYRFYSKNYKGHFYTIDEEEMRTIRETNPNWKYEGVAYYAYAEQAEGTVPLYRFYSKAYRGHFFTIDEAEMRTVRDGNPNWKYEGVAYYVSKEAASGTSPIYRFWSKGYRHHFYTMDYGEMTTLRDTNPNWAFEGTAFYAWPDVGENARNVGAAKALAAIRPADAVAGVAAPDGAAGEFGAVRFEVASAGVFPVGTFTLEVRMDVPDADELAAKTEAFAVPQLVPELSVALPDGTQTASVWSSLEGNLEKEEADVPGVVIRPSAMGEWFWVRAFGQVGAEAFSIWLRLLP